MTIFKGLMITVFSMGILSFTPGHCDDAPASADESIFKSVCDPGSAYGGDR